MKLLKTGLAVALALTSLARSEAEEGRIKSTIAFHASHEAVVPGSELEIGMRFVMPEGWHTYHETPGDSGMAPNIRMYDKVGVKLGKWQFPEPTTFTDVAGTTYGYENQVLLLNKLQVPEDLVPGDVLELQVSVMWLICKDICLPFQDKLRVKIPVVAASPAANADWSQLKVDGGWDQQR